MSAKLKFQTRLEYFCDTVAKIQKTNWSDEYDQLKIEMTK